MWLLGLIIINEALIRGWIKALYDQNVFFLFAEKQSRSIDTKVTMYLPISCLNNVDKHVK